MEAMLTWNYINMDEAGDQWGIWEPEDIYWEYLWALWKTNGISSDGIDLTTKDRYIDLYRALWFMMVRLNWKKHHNLYK